MRRYLTPKERKAMWDAQNGSCAVCKAPTSLAGMIAEHTIPVALGNTEKPDALLCKPCADRKTFGTKATTYGSDIHALAKIKRIRRKMTLPTTEGRSIQSRGFDKTLRRKFDGTVVRAEDNG